MSNCPKVSVFIATYNHARFLPECINSILAQTYQDFEIVIVDDGSTDGSDMILVDYHRRYPEKIKHLWHPGHVNKGISVTCNLAIKNTRGKYLAWLGSDDVWYPEKLMKQVAQLDLDPGLGFVYSYAEHIDEQGNKLPGMDGEDITLGPNPVGCMILSNRIPALTVLIRRECLEDVGLFDESLIYSDWDLFTRIFARWRVGFLDQPLALYRLHSSNISKNIDLNIDLNRLIDTLETLQRNADLTNGTLTWPRNLALIELQKTFFYFCKKNQDEAIEHLNEAFQIDPSLSHDIQWLNDWLCDWTHDYYARDSNFNFWIIPRLPPIVERGTREELMKSQLSHKANQTFYIRRGIRQGLAQAVPGDLDKIFDDWPENIDLPADWKNNILREVYATLLCESYRRQNNPKTRYYLIKSILYDPSLLYNRGVWSIGLKSLLHLRTNPPL